jgi:hypothetical protein
MPAKIDWRDEVMQRAFPALFNQNSRLFREAAPRFRRAVGVDFGSKSSMAVLFAAAVAAEAAIGGNKMDGQFRAYLAATIASGLTAAHGIDHGGVHADQIAKRSLAIADAIIGQTEPEPLPEPKQEAPAPAPNSDSGVAGSQAAPELTPVPPTPDPTAAQE